MRNWYILIFLTGLLLTVLFSSLSCPAPPLSQSCFSDLCRKAKERRWLQLRWGKDRIAAEERSRLRQECKRVVWHLWPIWSDTGTLLKSSDFYGTQSNHHSFLCIPVMHLTRTVLLIKRQVYLRGIYTNNWIILLNLNSTQDKEKTSRNGKFRVGKTERRPYRESFHSAVRNTCAEAVPHLTREMRAAEKRTWKGAETWVDTKCNT